jgi:hypothetical protein
MVVLKVLILLVSFFVSSTAYADFPLSAYSKFKGQAAFGDYLTGVGRGIFAANAILEHRHQSLLICAPDNFHFDRAIILTIIDHEIQHPSKGVHYSKDTPIELITAIAFVKKFPCK